MQLITLRDFWFTFFLVAIVGGAIAQIIAALVLRYLPRNSPPSGQSIEHNNEEAAQNRSPGTLLRLWLYYFLAVAVLLTYLVLWTWFWYPLVDASTKVSLSVAYQLLVPVVTAVLFVIVGNALLPILLKEIVHYERRFRGAQIRPGFYYQYAIPFGVVCIAAILLEGSLAWIQLARGALVITPQYLFLAHYATLFLISLIFLYLLFLWRVPLLDEAFDTGQ